MSLIHTKTVDRKASCTSYRCGIELKFSYRAGDVDIPVSTLGTSYVAATGGALATALGLNATVPYWTLRPLWFYNVIASPFLLLLTLHHSSVIIALSSGENSASPSWTVGSLHGGGSGEQHQHPSHEKDRAHRRWVLIARGVHSLR